MELCRKDVLTRSMKYKGKCNISKEARRVLLSNYLGPSPLSHFPQSMSLSTL